ncbi:MAG: zinc ribbon domain-containing protein [archaeon]|nr:zinc ribbon domain-containing protein [archaeon]
MRVCKHCGLENYNEDKYCSSCGKELESLPTTYEGVGLPRTVSTGFFRDVVDCVLFIIFINVIGVVLTILWGILLLLFENLFVFLIFLIVLGGIFIYLIVWFFLGIREQLKDRKRKKNKKN